MGRWVQPKRRRRYVAITDSDHAGPIFPKLTKSIVPDRPDQDQGTRLAEGAGGSSLPPQGSPGRLSLRSVRGARSRPNTTQATWLTSSSPTMTSTAHPHTRLAINQSWGERAMESTIRSMRVFASSSLWFPIRAVCRRYRERRMAASLNRLDDRMLKDIGVYRCAIPTIAHAQSTGQGRY
jgi:uncharacterized protein YjiS (DUF1127 family)